ncbi:MAG: hypothetical protein SPH30_01985 [Prevotella sp.]|nr:hypothetical protein [Prevotella sp.]
MEEVIASVWSISSDTTRGAKADNKGVCKPLPHFASALVAMT